MSHLKRALFFLMALSLGYGLSRYLAPSNPIPQERPEEVIDSEAIKSEAKEIKKNIVGRYFSEKDPAKKLVVGDEIMEKLVLMFMANLGMKLSDAEKIAVEEPQSYDQYMQKLLSLCPPLPKKTGPEVFLNDGSDEAKHKLEEQLKVCKETYSGLGKKPKLLSDEQKRAFVDFDDNIFKKYGRRPESLFAFDIFSELWTDSPYNDKLKGLPQLFISAYQGEFEGIYRTLEGEQGYIKLRITQNEKSKEDGVLIDLALSSKIGLFLKETYSADHPEGHSNSGKGSCRGIVLSKGKGRIGHLVKIPGQEGFFGRIYSGTKLVSSFFVMKDFSKKKLNPSRWRRERGYW